MPTTTRPARPLAARLAPLALALASVPLLAPTCGPTTPGEKTFSKGSVIIPMDACYQGASNVTPAAGCPSAATGATCGTGRCDRGDVVKAYGLVYQLIKNDVPVYWIIQPGKTTLTQVDLTLQITGGPPVAVYDWAAQQPGGMPPHNTGSSISYLGGPFVVDGTDWARVQELFRNGNPATGTPPLSSLYSAVKVHVAGVAFKGWAAKTFAGGWNAGGDVAPKLALLNIPGGDGRYADHVLEGYLIRAGLAPACVLDVGLSCATAACPHGGVCGAGQRCTCDDASGGEARDGAHGTIYDRLEVSDFIPAACTANPVGGACPAGQTCCPQGSTCDAVAGKCDWQSTNLHRYGYRVLWLPHWTATSSCTGSLGAGYVCGATAGCGLVGGDACSCVTCTPGPTATAAQIADVLQTMGGYVAAGNDLFGECGGIGSLEGIFGNAGAPSTTVNGAFGAGSAASRFMTAGVTGAEVFPAGGGLHYNEGVAGGATFNATQFSSAFLQIGDFPYTPTSGLIDKYRPAASSGSRWKDGALHLIAGTTTGGQPVDYFTVQPAADASSGNVVYLAGHDYSGFQGTFQIAGTRLVLNTLFNLGAACVETLAPCRTGKLGQCAIGEMRCVGGVPSCVQKFQPQAETCNGLDDDCNGAVDDVPPEPFYTGPPGTKDVGLCHGGVNGCVGGAVVETAPQVTPRAEQCNGLDDDCNGAVDDGVGSRACFDAATGCTQNPDGTFACQGACRTGTQACVDGSWSACQGDVGPSPELCEPPTDTNCNGVAGDGCGCYPPGQARACYTGSAGTENVGACRAGAQTCLADGTWGTCQGDVVPASPACDGDRDCNGIPDGDQVCCEGGSPASSQSCYTGPAGTLDVGVCRAGVRPCVGSTFSSTCQGQVLPSAELCNGKDDDCNGQADDGALCSTGTTCVNGACVPLQCGALEPPFCPEGYTCDQGTCKLAACGATPCRPGEKCVSGACVDPCQGVSCGAGAFCSGGLCTGGGCFSSGCPAGEVCAQGVCQASGCNGVSCPEGTFCRGGYCVQSCAFTRCRGGERCGSDGFCVADPCLGLACGAGKVCVVSGGTPACADDPCQGKTCGDGQICQDGRCLSDPCAGLTCPVGHCASGQCFSAANPGGIGSDPPPAPGGGGGGGCGHPADGLAALALALAALPAAGRRRARRAGGTALSALLLGAALLAGCSGGSEKTASPFPCVTQCGATCTDLTADPTNCGSCGRACAGGQICVDGTCGPGSAVAPYLVSLSPASAASGTSASIQVDGQRFQPGATVLLTGAAAPLTSQVADAGRLTAQVDLSQAGPARCEIRVLNPDRTISNALPFEVTFPSPRLTSVSPDQAVSRIGDPPGGPAAALDLTLAGSGFATVSQCHLAGPDHPDEGLVTALSGGSLRCTVDLGVLQPGAYELWVVNAGTVASNRIPFTVLTTDPVLVSISPTGGQSGTLSSITATGSGFDASSVVLLDGQPFGRTTFVSGTRLYAAPLDLKSVPLGPHQVTVANGGRVSAPQVFTVTEAPPYAAGIVPGSARQGSTVQVTVTGSGFGSSPRLRVVDPGGTAQELTPSSASATEVKAAFTFASAGEYLWTVVNSAGSSDALPFRALSNVAVLAGLTPATAPQGAQPTLTLTAQNLEAGARLHLTGPGQDLDLAATVALPSTVTASLDLAGWNTGTYSLTLLNPGASASNGLGFSVTPGSPGLTGICVGSGCSPAASACVVQTAQPGANPVQVFLAGSNFARPDAGGNVESAVHAASSSCRTPPGGCDVPDFVLPASAVTVTDAGHLVVDFDTTQAIPDVYDVTVWNPGPTGVLKSPWVTLTVRAGGQACP